MKFIFPVIIIDEDFESQNSSGLGVRALAEAIRQENFEVLGITSYGDFTIYAQQQSRASAFVLSIDDEDFEKNEAHSKKVIHNILQFIKKIRLKNSDIPIFLYGETKTSHHIPNEILCELNGFIHMQEDTPEFVAKRIVHDAKTYLENIAPPFFKALLNYAQNGSYSWHCPGHSGGVAFLKTPIGQMFHQFFGENMLRVDVSSSVDELGQLLDHTGPVAESEKNAARIFNADHLFFVTNGTSTSNKIVWNSTVAADDIVIVDRNCHKSILHAIMMTGAIPIFLTPTRNHYGLIGPIPQSEFSMENIQKKIDANPFIKNKKQKPRILTLTQSTYDGIIYNVEKIKSQLDGKIDTLHFDEAWLPHASFHNFYQDMHAIGQGRPRAKSSIIMATQSTHKLLAGLSQASQILINNSEEKKLNKEIFNEAYLMHTSTSPQYAIIASCDVAASMMEQPGGHSLVEESLSEALDFRRAMRKVNKDWKKGWWFKVWGPQNLPETGIGSREDWMLKSNDEWHGFGALSEQFNMLDPIKATLITPGLNMNGDFEDMGIPAAVVKKYLLENGVVVEKCGLYSFFIMFTIGITKGRWNTLVTALQQFKDDYDNNKPLVKSLRDFTKEYAKEYPEYEQMGLKDLCQKIHDDFKRHNVAKMTTDMYISDITVALKPVEASAKIAHEKIERVPVQKLNGRICATLLTPYPPGIPLLIPGECFNTKITDYLNYTLQFDQKFPGFDTDIHGLVCENNHGQKSYFMDCIKEEKE